MGWVILLYVLFVLTVAGLAAVAESQRRLRRRMDRLHETLDAVIQVQDRLRAWTEERVEAVDERAAEEHSALAQLVTESRRVAGALDRQHRRIVGLHRAVGALRPATAVRTQEFYS